MISCLVGLALLCAQSEAPVETSLDWMQCVRADGMHNAFTDLVRWRDAFYLCFRQGTSHGSMNGKIEILASPDMKTWKPSKELDTYGDDRDPHFCATPNALYVYFGTWDLRHFEDHRTPGRGCVRSYFASTVDGETWSKIQGVYQEGWWLWRVRHHDGLFYSAAYRAVRPAPAVRETKLLGSKDGLEWTEITPLENDRSAGEADILFHNDGKVWIASRTGAPPGNAYLFQSDATLKTWEPSDLGVLIHSPAMALWKERCFIAGRAQGGEAKHYVTKIFELVDGKAVERITLPSGGDTSYPGLILDPEAANAESPSFFVSWYSQHERETTPNATPDTASVYVGRVTIRP